MLSLEELNRYKRQIVLPEFGLEGQSKLKKSSVLVIGAGGLGSPLSMYLAAAGVGKIGVIDFDNVDGTNLQRQILFRSEDTGKNKAETAVRILQNLNSFIDFKIYPYRLTVENVEEVVREFDVIADGSDNFSTRYLVNDACVLNGKPLVSAAVYRFEGQLTVYNFKEGHCLRCLYPDLQDTVHIQSCADAGVIGSVTGVMGSLQANEVIKVITGMGKSFAGRVLVFDALNTEFHEFSVKRNSACSGKCSRINRIVPENYLCEIVTDVEEISASEIYSRLKSDENLLIVDLRMTEGEGIPGSVKIAKEDLATFLMGKLNREIVLFCDIGIRSEIAAGNLKKIDINVKTLAGGFYEWLEYISKIK